MLANNVAVLDGRAAKCSKGKAEMTGLFPPQSSLGHALLVTSSINANTLTLFKSILVTVLVVLAIAQILEQALLYRWIRVSNLNRPLVVRLHRLGGIAAVLLVLAVLGTCLYTLFGLGYPLSTTRVVAHVVLGSLVTLFLLIKVAIANWFRQHLGLTLPVGISAGLLLLGVFLLTALPYFLGRL
jgi:hypothetical protein